MTDRYLAIVLLLALAVMQMLAGLHRGSGGGYEGSHAGSALHDRLFSRLEGVSPDPVLAEQPHGTGGISGSSSQRLCDQLDDQFNPHGAASQTLVTLTEHVAHLSPLIDPPARLSRHQRLGPPSQGPPLLNA